MIEENLQILIRTLYLSPWEAFGMTQREWDALDKYAQGDLIDGVKESHGIHEIQERSAKLNLEWLRGRLTDEEILERDWLLRFFEPLIDGWYSSPGQ